MDGGVYEGVGEGVVEFDVGVGVGSGLVVILDCVGLLFNLLTTPERLSSLVS